jgi:iron complex outermembrane receptor protein
VRIFTNVDNGATVGSTLPPTVYFLINRDVGNVLYLDVAGIDAMVDWSIDFGAIGTFILGASMTYFTQFDQAVSASDPSFSILNTSGYNSQFPSIQTKARFSVGYENGPFSATVFANYTGEYNNWINTSVIPITSDAAGNPTGGGDPVDSDLIWDLNASWDFQGALEGNSVYIDVKNVLDSEPPFYNGNTTGAGGVGGWGFNGFTSNAMGRIVSVGFRARF